MRIKWLGHSCFKITSIKGVRIVTDPFDDNVGYKIPSVEADIVTISHGHYDHNFVDCITGKFDVLDKPGVNNIKGINITGVHTYHDQSEGQQRGNNIAFVYDIDEMRVCHLGDLGHLLSQEQINSIGKVDVLLIPVGGTFTINGEEAAEVVNQLKPSIVIPMHYKTPSLRINLDTADSFLEKIGNVEKLNSQLIEINKDKFVNGITKVYTLKYE